MDVNQETPLPPNTYNYPDTLHAGYRFVPTDEELVQNYLICKIRWGKHPPCRMYEVNFYDFNPVHLAAQYRSIEDKWFFFTSIQKRYPNGNVRKRNAMNYGHWRASQKHTIMSKDNMNTPLEIGTKRSFVFYDDINEKTNWLLHEYTTTYPNLWPGSGQNRNQINDLVLCKLYKKETNQASSVHQGIGYNHGTTVGHTGTNTLSHYPNITMQPMASSTFHGSTSTSTQPALQVHRHEFPVTSRYAHQQASQNLRSVHNGPAQSMTVTHEGDDKNATKPPYPNDSGFYLDEVVNSPDREEWLSILEDHRQEEVMSTFA